MMAKCKSCDETFDSHDGGSGCEHCSAVFCPTCEDMAGVDSCPYCPTAKQELPDLQSGHYCYYVGPGMEVEGKGFRPSLVVEGQSGHYPNGGGDVEPWYWGDDLTRAEAICAHYNDTCLNLTTADVDRIVASSMRIAG